jgi:hypothetical protein
MAQSSFQPNSSGIRDLMDSTELQAACVAEAERAQAIAEGLAAEITRTGEYERSFQVRPDRVVVVTRRGISIRNGAVLENTSGHAAAVEWGNAHDHTPHHILNRTLDLLGNPSSED